MASWQCSVRRLPWKTRRCGHVVRPFQFCSGSKSPSANRLPEVAETLAYHYASTSRADKAFLYLAMAAKKCLDIHSLDEADRYARQALDLRASNPGCPDNLAAADVMANHLNILYEKSAFLEIKRVAERYMPQLEAMGDTAQLVFTLYFHALALSGCNEFTACEALSKKANDVAERVGDLKAKSYAMNGILHASVFLRVIPSRPWSGLAQNASP